MISFENLQKPQLQELLEWIQSPIALEVFFPRVLAQRQIALEKLVKASEAGNVANVLRGEIRNINKLLNLNDQIIEYLETIPEEKSSDKKKQLDKSA